MKPILAIRDGEVVPIKRVRGRSKSLAELERLFTESTTDSESLRIGVAHAADPAAAEDLPAGCGRRGRDASLEIPGAELGPVIGTHGGPGTLGVFWFDDPDRLAGMPPVAHWDDVEPRRRERGHIAGSWRDLGEAAGSVTVGLQRIQVDPGMWSTPLHLEGAEEEIFFVLGGAGHSVLWHGDEDTGAYAVGAGDCLVHLALEEAHTLSAGPEGLDVLAFGMRTYADSATYLPRAGVAWLGATWVEAGAEENHPWTREAAAGPPDFAEFARSGRRRS